jgi:hypothetical protein
VKEDVSLMTTIRASHFMKHHSLLALQISKQNMQSIQMKQLAAIQEDQELANTGKHNFKMVHLL